PVVGIPSVVAIEHDPNVIVYRAAVLERLSRAKELGSPVGIKSLESAYSGFGDDDAVRVNPEVVIADNHAGQPVHQNAEAALGLYVENDVPPGARNIVAPIIVAHHDLVIPRITSSGDKGAAVLAGGGRGWAALLPVEPRDIVTRQLFHGVQRCYVPTIGLD